MQINVHLAAAFIRHVLFARRKGHGVHSPFAYALCEQVFSHAGEFYAFSKLKQMRSRLEHDPTLLEVEDHGAGSHRLPHRSRRVSEIARHGISTRSQSEMLFRLCAWLGARDILELGTSLGLNSLYLAMSGSGSRVTTIEGAPALHDYAVKLAAANEVKNITHVCGTFEEALPELVQGRKYDLVYMDGHHTKEATLRYFEMLLPSLTGKSVVIVDDIYWSRGMTEAWEALRKHPSVTMWLDGFRCGMLFFSSDVKEPTGYRVWMW